MEDEQALGKESDGLAEEVNQSMGISDAQETENSSAEEEGEMDLPKGVKERLGRQEKRHKKEMRDLRGQLDSLRGQVSSPNTGIQQQSNDQYSDQGQSPDGIEGYIHKAVNYALQQKERQERTVKEQEKIAHVEKRHQELMNNLDKTSEKYEDFDDVINSPDSRYITENMRNAAYLLDNPGEVFYKLAKNPAELKRISELHPLEQGREMVKLSHALMAGNEKSAPTTKILGQIKSNPVTNSTSVNEKTSISDLRSRMKAGWK